MKKSEQIIELLTSHLDKIARECNEAEGNYYELEGYAPEDIVKQDASMQIWKTLYQSYVNLKKIVKQAAKIAGIDYTTQLLEIPSDPNK